MKEKCFSVDQLIGLHLIPIDSFHLVGILISVSTLHQEKESLFGNISTRVLRIKSLSSNEYLTCFSLESSDISKDWSFLMENQYVILRHISYQPSIKSKELCDIFPILTCEAKDILQLKDCPEVTISSTIGESICASEEFFCDDQWLFGDGKKRRSQKCVNYTGIVTDLSFSELGIYEVDNEVLVVLCSDLNVSQSENVNAIKIFNAHPLIINGDDQWKFVLFACSCSYVCSSYERYSSFNNSFSKTLFNGSVSWRNILLFLKVWPFIKSKSGCDEEAFELFRDICRSTTTSTNPIANGNFKFISSFTLKACIEHSSCIVENGSDNGECHTLNLTFEMSNSYRSCLLRLKEKGFEIVCGLIIGLISLTTNGRLYLFNLKKTTSIAVCFTQQEHEDNCNDAYFWSNENFVLIQSFSMHTTKSTDHLFSGANNIDEVLQIEKFKTLQPLWSFKRSYNDYVQFTIEEISPILRNGRLKNFENYFLLKLFITSSNNKNKDETIKDHFCLRANQWTLLNYWFLVGANYYKMPLKKLFVKKTLIGKSVENLLTCTEVSDIFVDQSCFSTMNGESPSINLFEALNNCHVFGNNEDISLKFVMPNIICAVVVDCFVQSKKCMLVVLKLKDLKMNFMIDFLFDVNQFDFPTFGYIKNNVWCIENALVVKKAAVIHLEMCQFTRIYSSVSINHNNCTDLIRCSKLPQPIKNIRGNCDSENVFSNLLLTFTAILKLDHDPSKNYFSAVLLANDGSSSTQCLVYFCNLETFIEAFPFFKENYKKFICSKGSGGGITQLTSTTLNNTYYYDCCVQKRFTKNPNVLEKFIKFYCLEAKRANVKDQLSRYLLTFSKK